MVIDPDSSSESSTADLATAHVSATAAAPLIVSAVSQGKQVEPESIVAITAYEAARQAKAREVGLPISATVAEIVESARRAAVLEKFAALSPSQPELEPLIRHARDARPEPNAHVATILCRIWDVAEAAEQGPIKGSEIRSLLGKVPELDGAIALAASGLLTASISGMGDPDAAHSAGPLGPEQPSAECVETEPASLDSPEPSQTEPSGPHRAQGESPDRSLTTPQQEPPSPSISDSADHTFRGAVRSDSAHVEDQAAAQPIRHLTSALVATSSRDDGVRSDAETDSDSTTTTDESSAVGSAATTPRSDSPPGPSSGEPQLSDVDRLIRSERDGLAALLASAQGMSPTLSTALRALALSRTVGSGQEENAAACRLAMEEIATSDEQFDHATRLLCLAAAVPVAASVPHLGAAQVLALHSAALSDAPAAASLVDALRQAADKGISVRRDIAGAASSWADMEAERSGLSARAAELLAHPPKVKYQRASQVLRTLLHPDGDLGRILSPVAAGDSSGATNTVRTLSSGLVSKRAVQELIDEHTQGLKATQRRVIDGDARGRISATIDEVVGIGQRWADLQDELNRPLRDDAWLQDAASGLRTAAQHFKDVGVPKGWPSGGGLCEAAAIRLVHSLAYLERLLDGQVEPVDGRPAQLVLYGELLRSSSIRLSADLSPLEDLGSDQLAPLIDPPDWATAARERATQGNAPLVDWLLGMLDDDERVAIDAEIASRLLDAKSSAELLAETIKRDVASQYQRGALGPDDWDMAMRRLDQLEQADGYMVGELREQLEHLRDDVQAARTAHVERQSASIFELLTPLDSGHAARQLVVAALADGDVATAERIALDARRGRGLPAEKTVNVILEKVFPAVPELLLSLDATPDDIAKELATERSLFGLPAPEWSDELLRQTCDALEALELVSIPDKVGRDAVQAVLGLLGLVAESVRNGPTEARWRSWDVAARVSDRAVVPQFGSHANGLYRILALPATDATEGRISSWLEEHPADRATIILYPRTLPLLVRRRLAERAQRAARGSQALLVDLAVAASVAALAPASFEHTARLALPFTGLNPYNPYASGLVPQEMFYGRRTAIDDLLDADGQIAFVYGGRRLGKSALLRDAQRRASERPDIVARYLDLQDNGVGEYEPASKALELIEAALGDVLPESRKQAVSDRLADRVAKHFERPDAPRILVLLDESDRMIDADASQDFRTLNALRTLTQATDKKVRFVFAGLHSVRRFHDLANQRLVHFGRHLTVGALDPADARKLIERPLEALGYRLEDDSINRILTLTQHQPSLIQLVCDELLKHLAARTRDPASPPYDVRTADVDRVLSLPKLTREITDRFELTIRLDEHYRLIALLVAYLAADDHMHMSFDVGELMEQAQSWWPAAFSSTTRTEFEALLDEMVGLSVLFERNGLYGLYSPHVGRMLGSQEQIENQLVDAASQPAPSTTFDGTALRQALPNSNDSIGYRVSPLSLSQVTELLQVKNSVYLIQGTSALNVGDVGAAISSLIATPGEIEVLTAPSSLENLGAAQWLVARAKAATRSANRVVVAEAGAIPGAELAVLLSDLGEVLSRPHKSRKGHSAAIVIDNRSLSAWITVLSAGLEAAGSFERIPLRRHTRKSLEVWSSRGVELPWFERSETADQILAATGGWPMLVDTVVKSLRRDRDLDKALMSLESSDELASLPAAAGLTADDKLRMGFDTLCELHSGLDPSEAPALLADLHGWSVTTADAVWRTLQAIAVVDVDPSSGAIRPEPLLASLVGVKG